MYKTWIEIDRRAIAHNVQVMRSLLDKKTKLWAVVKSNAYGHGLVLFSKEADARGVDGFCVDSVIEGLKLRQHGVKKPILVLGPTLNKENYLQAKKNKITVTISTFEALKILTSLKKNAPEFHVKIDTGMHRQGFLLEGLSKCIFQITNYQLPITGLYTHFATPTDRTFTEAQFSKFKKAIAQFEDAGFTNLIRHAAATGGVLADARYHLDAVRIGGGFYGLSEGNSFTPVLSWYAVISEVKGISKEECVGYGCLFRTRRRTTIAIVPIGYWHGVDRRAFPGMKVLVRGTRVPVIGKVSMDMIVLDVTNIPVRVGDYVTLIGRDKKETISPREFSAFLGTTSREALTRINPLIERVLR